MSRGRATTSVVAVLAVTFVLAACGDTTASGLPTDLPPNVSASTGPDPVITEPPVGSDDTARIFGPWAPSPLYIGATQATVAAADAVCRAALTDAGLDAASVAAAPRVIADVRGAGVAWLVFAEGDHAADCRVAIADDLSASVVDISTLGTLGAPPADEKIEILAYGTLQDVSSGRTYALGRAGRLSVTLIAGFPDESEALGSLGSGWFLVWWPGYDVPVGIAGVDMRRLVVAGLPAPTAAP